MWSRDRKEEVDGDDVDGGLGFLVVIDTRLSPCGHQRKLCAEEVESGENLVRQQIFCWRQGGSCRKKKHVRGVADSSSG